MGHQVTIIAGQVAKGTRDEMVYSLERAGVPRNAAHRALVGFGYRVAHDLTVSHLRRRAILTTVRRAVAERAIQIIESEETFGDARWISQEISIPVCVRLHGPWFLNGPAHGCPRDGTFRRRVFEEGLAIRAAHGVTAPSRDVLERTRDFYGLALPNAEVIPGTVPPVPVDQRWRFEDCDTKAVLFVGRFDRHKGGDLMVEGFGRVLREIPEARLWYVGVDKGYIAGDGRTWKIEDFIRERLPGALEAGRIRWLGFQSLSELNRLRRKAMVTVVCSRYENFPSALIEAMTMGCPVVAAGVGGIPEVVEDHVNGLLHRPEDTDDLAAKILSLMSDPHRAAQLGCQAAVTCERRFQADVIATRTLDFYRRLIAQFGFRNHQNRSVR
jgi:glycosyltransferase involved in cell wall biosynthesis